MTFHTYQDGYNKRQLQVDEDVEKQETSYIPDGYVKYCSHFVSFTN